MKLQINWNDDRAIGYVTGVGFSLSLVRLLTTGDPLAALIALAILAVGIFAPKAQSEASNPR